MPPRRRARASSRAASPRAAPSTRSSATSAGESCSTLRTRRRSALNNMLHVTIHAGPRDVACQAERLYQGQLVSPLALTPADWLPLAVTFEQVAAALEVLPRMFFEPDGSFVWVSPDGEPHWQLDGQ